MRDTRIFATIVKREPIMKGWSSDKKYCIETAGGRRLLLRVSDITEFDRRKTEYEMVQKVANLGVPMSVPVEFGTCEDGVYSIYSWIEGEDIKPVLPKFSQEQQYAFGLKAGEMLRKIHSIPTPENQANWEESFNRMAENKIRNYLGCAVESKVHDYLGCGLRFEGDGYILGYIEKNSHLIKNRPLCFLHGDYHPGNMMIENDELKIIDFNRCSYGDPWEDFNCIEWDAALSPHFATGQLRGYFGGEPPLEFFMTLAFYIACNQLAYIHGVAVGLNDFDVMTNQARDVLAWFVNMNNPVPAWYVKA